MQTQVAAAKILDRFNLLKKHGFRSGDYGVKIQMADPSGNHRIEAKLPIKIL